MKAYKVDSISKTRNGRYYMAVGRGKYVIRYIWVSPLWTL